MTRSFSYIIFLSSLFGALPLARGQRQESSSVSPASQTSASATARPETIVIVGRARKLGPHDLRGKSSEHNDAATGLHNSAFKTVVRVDDSEGERRTVGEVLARSVGVSTRSLGGMGAFSSMSVRGADAGQTQVLVDGLPLSRIASVTANLGQFELESFDLIELYRGGVPPELAGAGAGGAVNLRTALGVRPGGKALMLSMGSGSFGAKHLRARWLGGTRGSERAYQVSLGYSGARGDFSFFDDGRTSLTTDDDRIQVRQNNGYERFDLLGRLRSGRWTVGNRTSLQSQGVPGDSHLQSTQARLSTLNQILDSQYRSSDLFAGKGTFRARGFASIERQHYADPADEIGLLSQDTVYRTTSTGVGATLVLAPSPAHTLSSDMSARLDWFRDDPVGDSPLPPSAGNRQSSRLSLSEHFQNSTGFLAIDLSVSADALRTRPSQDLLSPPMTTPPSERREYYLSPRASARILLLDSLALKGSAGRYLRTPTLVEAFGDRGFLLGNPDLKSEIGFTGDVGLVWAPSNALGPVDRIYLEAAAFATRAQTPIVFVNRNGLVAQAINLEGSRVYGTELVASLRLAKSLTFSSNYSLLVTRNLAMGAAYGKQLPGRPLHRFYARADAAFAPLGHLLVVWGDLLRQSGNYLDELNLAQVPSRSLLGAGIKFEIFEDLLVGFEAKNLTDLRRQDVELSPAPRADLRWVPKALSDVHGFPLPGRALYLNVQWSH